jgi:transposase
VLAADGIRCLVAAPSKLQRPAGDRVKTDVRDARHLARLLHLGEIVAVAVPSVELEAARDLVRAREGARKDLMSARHRLLKLLLRHGVVYSGGRAVDGATRSGGGRSGCRWSTRRWPTTSRMRRWSRLSVGGTGTRR